MKKQSIIYCAVIGLILAAIFTTLAGCKGDENVAVYNPVPAGEKFNYPSGIVALSATELYVADTTNHTIRKIVINSLSPLSVTVSTFAGKAGTPGEAPDTDGDINTRTSTFRYPRGITTDGLGNLYVADTNNHMIRKVVIATGNVSTLTGTSGKPPADLVDGDSATARFNRPFGITFNSATGKLYVADTDYNAIREIDAATGDTLTLASGTTVFNKPIGVATDSTIIYVSDTDNHKIRTIDTANSNQVDDLAGSGSFGHADGIGIAATFYKPAGLALNGTKLFVADQYNQLIRFIDVDPISTTYKKVTTLKGIAEKFYKSDGQVPTRFKFPQGIATLDGTTLYVADTFGHILRKLDIIDITADPPDVDLSKLTGVPLYAGSVDTEDLVP
jgi:DNA-binding beta-propeller fold protein YncE